MRTHHFSISIDAIGVSGRSVAIIQKTYDRGVLRNVELVYGPLRVQRADLQRVLWQTVERLEHMLGQEQAGRPE